MDTPLIYHFKTKAEPKILEVGGKALSLIKMTQANFEVPNGFVLAVKFFNPWFREVKKNSAWKAFSKSSDDNIKKHCNAVKKSCKSLKLTSLQKKELEKAIKKLSKTPLLAVRSSSPAEDLEGTSFAGGYETTLGVTNKTLEKAILNSFISLFDERIVKYKLQHKMKTDNPRIAVIVQEQLASDVSGVAFSLNPQNNCYDEAVINSNFGLGETIVAGQITPDTFIVDKVKSKILDKKIAKKDHSLWLKKNGGTKKKNNKKPKKPSLTDKQAIEITKLVENVEKHYGKPMDIEWAYSEEKLYLLQARPITGYLPLFPEMITKPGEKKNIYLDIIGLTQGFSEPFSVLGLDIWARMLVFAKGPLMKRGIDAIVFDIHGRQYLHMSNMMKAAGGLMKKMITTYDTPTRNIFENLDLKEYTPNKIPVPLKGYVWRVTKYMVSMVPSMVKGFIDNKKSLDTYHRVSEGVEEYIKKDLPKENKSFNVLVDNGLGKFEDMLAVAGNLIMILIAPYKLKKIFKKNNKAQDMLVALNMDLPGNPTSEMGHLMLQIASFPEFQKTKKTEEFIKKIKTKKYSKKFLKTYKEYIDRFGCRGMKEVDIATPRLYENLADVFKQLKQINIKNNAITDVKERREQAYVKLLKMAKKLGKEKKFIKYAKLLNQTAGIREHPKYIYVMIVDGLRKHALRIGKQFVEQGRLKNVNQIFDLNIKQVSKAQKDPKLKLLPLIEKNLAPYKTVAHVKDWPRIVDSRGKIYRAKRDGKKGELVGDAISPGVIKGKAKVLHSPYEKPLHKGEILVAKMSEPSWTPIFINASGVVLEVGGPLQHGAIIAREYGLPCVSGVDGATKIIKDGDLLEVDGSNGVVHVNFLIK